MSLVLDTTYNGDCLEVMSKMEDNSVDYVFTSPPYNRKRNDKYTHYDDRIEDYYGFLVAVLEECLRVSKKFVFFNIQATYYNAQDVYKLIGEFSDSIKQTIIWEKTNPLPASGNNITNAYEFILVLGSGNEPFQSNFSYTKNIIHTSVNSNMPKEHKAVMHYDVADWVIRNFTQEKEVVLDPFMGTGTTALACVKNNRHYIGIEISPDYCTMSNDRVKNVTVQSNLFGN